LFAVDGSRKKPVPKKLPIIAAATTATDAKVEQHAYRKARVVGAAARR
jgi:hypothetical protein